MRRERSYPVVVIHGNHHLSPIETTPYLANDEAELLAAIKAVAKDEAYFDEEAAALTQMATTVSEALQLMGCRSIGNELYTDAFFDGSIGIMPIAVASQGGKDAQ